MKTRIHLNSFNVLSFAVVPVTLPVEEPEGAGPEPLGHIAPQSLEEWFTSGGALEICGTVTAELSNVFESGLLNQQLARSRCCPSRHLRRALPFAGDRLTVSEGSAT